MSQLYMLAPFIGRQKELQALNKLFKKNSASLVVVQGRRRIGKSRLIEEFAKNHTFYQFSGILPTDRTTMQSQLDEFARQLSMQTGLPEVKADDWSKLFLLLAGKAQQGRVIVLFDEITWMGSKDPDFLGKLKNAWDVYFKKNPELILILCGSISVWIEDNILSSTGFLGRISYRLTLEELPLSDCNRFWDKAGGVISPYEKLKILAVTGGVPRYLEEVKPTLSAEENIKEIITYIALDNPTASETVAGKFEKSLSNLSIHPFIGKIPNEGDLAGMGYRFLIVQNYLIFYALKPYQQNYLIQKNMILKTAYSLQQPGY